MVLKETFSKTFRKKETRVLPDTKSPFGYMRRDLEKSFGRVIREIEATTETTMQFLPSGQASLDKQLELIEHPATDHAYLQSFTIDPDSVGTQFTNKLTRAAQDHPDVSYGLLVDHIYVVRNGFRAAQQVRKMLTQINSNGQVHVVVTNFFNFLGIHENTFHRNHQKIASDGKRAVITTANIGEHHTRWLDAGIYFEGPVAEVIDEIVANTFGYAKRWKHVYETTDVVDYIRKYGVIPQYADVLGAVVRNADDRGKRIIVKSPKGQIIEVLTDSYYKPYQEATNAAFDMIEHAAPHSTVDVFTPYPGFFTLTDKMLKAREHNVTINLHIPSNNDYALYNAELVPGIFRPVITMQLTSWKKKLEEAGIHVYEYTARESGGMAHVKAVRVANPDGTGRLWFGSSNLNKGLFSGSNREIAVLLEDTDILGEFDKFANEYCLSATKLF